MDFAPLKPYMLELAQACQAVVPGLPGTPCTPIALDREFDADAASSPPKSPALVSPALSGCTKALLSCEPAANSVHGIAAVRAGGR